MQKNVASQKWSVFAFDRTDLSAKTGDAANITADLFGDGVSNAVDDTNPTELAHGYYEFDITQPETNYDYIVMDAVSVTGDIQVVGVPGALWTTPPAFNTFVLGDAAGVAPTAVENRAEMDSNSTELAKIGTIPALDGAGQTVGAAIAKLADDNGGADFDATNHSLKVLRDESDGLQGTDGKALISTDAQDLSATLDVNTKTITAGIIAAATFAANALDANALAADAVTEIQSGLALAAVLGALADAAADGDPTNADTLMQYVKQLINILIGTDGIVAFPAESAPGNAISLAEVIRAIHVDVTGVGGITPAVASDVTTAHATTDGKVDAIQTDLGNFSGRTNDQTLLDVLGVPDVAGKDLHTLLVTDRLDNGTYGLPAIRTRGDAAWITGGGGGITDILNIQALIPNDIDLANTATVRIGLGLTNMLDDLPTTVEITPGTITIDRKAIGGTSWSNVVNAAACLEAAGLIYYDEVFDSGTGYAESDSIRITFKNQKIVVAANDYEITGSDGWIFQTSIRQTMAGTDNGALATVCTEGRLAELDAGNLPTDVAAIPTTAMRGTDSAALATVATEARLAELDAGNLPTDIAAIPTTAMRGTDSAALATVATEARLAELDAGNLPTDIAAIPTTAMRGTDNAATASALSTHDGKLDTVVTSTNLLPEAPQKNVALDDLEFLMVDATDFATPETGLTVTGQVSKDGAAFGNIAGSIAEVSNGIYSCDAAQADMNADLLTFRFSSAGAADTFITIKTTA